MPPLPTHLNNDKHDNNGNTDTQAAGRERERFSLPRGVFLSRDLCSPFISEIVKTDKRAGKGEIRDCT